jgi:phosphate transport system permease protein
MHSTHPSQQSAGDSPRSLLPTGERRARLRRWRAIKDKISKYGISFAGISVVLAFATIFVYLFSEVGPLFSSASVEQKTSYQSPSAQPLHSNIERYGEVGLTITSDAQLQFFNADTGALTQEVQLALPANVTVTAFGKADPRTGTIILGLSNGQALIAKHEYLLSYPNDQRQVNPKVSFPLGEAPVQVDAQGQALLAVAIQEKDENRMLSAYTADGRLVLSNMVAETVFLTGETTVVRTDYSLPDAPASASKILIDNTFQNLFVSDKAGHIHYYAINNPEQARLVQSVNAVSSGSQITAMEFLVGTVSLVVGSSKGELSQWFLVRDQHNNFDLKQIRDFEQHPGAITQIESEYSRKGFMAIDDKGHLGIHYGTSARTLFLESFDDGLIAKQIAVSPINTNFLMLDDKGQMHKFELENAHPDVSYKALWNEVWYEGRDEAKYIWQASAGSDEFEAKMSMVPLAIGTLKAAFFAMLFATPLAIMSAIYVAYFMTPVLRGKVKPTIEIMAALPTVILGFLAGLWLAPFIEEYLSAVFAILFLMPFMMLAAAYLWRYMPESIRNRFGLGWEAAFLVPVIILFGYLAISASPMIDNTFFDGSLRQWFTDNGINYDQRNALIVGIAMGFAVIPNIFSIAEDAIFNVPRHLTQGSLALGATPWQTMVGVVLPTASPGVFAAVMVGFGRAVGETMIVLMATGNSPVVNFNIFEGMRTLSANIAVELPETAVGSTHFRVLFLAALVLFVFTFVFNTLAEVIRQRLRQRFSNL